MEFEKAKNLLKPENARYIPLAAWGAIGGLVKIALDEIGGKVEGLKDMTTANIEYHSTGFADDDHS